MSEDNKENKNIAEKEKQKPEYPMWTCGSCDFFGKQDCIGEPEPNNFPCVFYHWKGSPIKLTLDDDIIYVAQNPDILDMYMEHLSLKVKRDYYVKRMVFFVGFSAYSPDPKNLFLKGPSSIGKTWNVTNALQYFPSEDIWFLGGLSPTALIHDYGLYDKEKKAYVIDLRYKILVFLEAPHIETYMRLRPILSHDKDEITYKFTEKSGRGKLRTTKVIIRGWPATVFCTTDPKYVEDLATRSYTVTPDTTSEKIHEAIKLSGKMKAFPWMFQKDKNVELLRKYIRYVRGHLALEDYDVSIPFGGELAEIYPHTDPRDMRDYNHFTAIIELLTQLHLCQRPALFKGKEYPISLISTKNDLRTATEIFSGIYETTFTGVSGTTLNFYDEVLDPLKLEEEKISYEKISRKYRFVHGRGIGNVTLWEIYLKPLESIGLLERYKDDEDKRKTLFRILGKPENVSEYLDKIFQGLFSEEDLKSWFDEGKNYLGETEFEDIVIKNNILDQREVDLLYILELMPTETFQVEEKRLESSEKPENGMKKLNETIRDNFSITCWMCHKIVHPQEPQTVLDGKTIHLHCFQKIRKQQIKTFRFQGLLWLLKELKKNS